MTHLRLKDIVKDIKRDFYIFLYMQDCCCYYFDIDTKQEAYHMLSSAMTCRGMCRNEGMREGRVVREMVTVADEFSILW